MTSQVVARAKLIAKLDALVNLIDSDRAKKNDANFAILQEGARKNGRRNYDEIGYEIGRRFTKFWSETSADQHKPQRSVCYFVENETGKIFGARSWNAYNPRRQYGTLDTMHDWYWGEYYAQHRTEPGRSTLVPIAERV
jgi:hypothetical protein